MIRIALSAAALLASAAAAAAADLPTFEAAPVMAPAPAYSWTGLYVGVQAGYAFGENDDNILEFDTDLDGDFGDTVLTGAGADAFAPGFDSDFDDGFSGGGRIGYDHQFGSFVLGVVGDISFVDVSDSVTGTSVTPADYTFDRELEFLATGRLKGGFAFNRFLVYATGGFAYGSLDSSFSTDSPAILVDVDTGDDDAWGYTVGGGVEALLTNRISIGAEYLYTDLDTDAGTARFATAGGGAPFGTGTDLRPEDDEFDFHTVRATLTYRFNSGM